MGITGILDTLFGSILEFRWQMAVMWLIGGILIFCAIKFEMEPTLLLPMGFGAILVNLPLSAVLEVIECPVCGTIFKEMTADGLCNVCEGGTMLTSTEGPILALLKAGINNELFPLLLFIGIGAMIDFGPLLRNPKLMLFGAAAQFGIFFTLCMASLFFDKGVAASIAIIGAADGPTSIFVANTLLGPIANSGGPQASEYAGYIGAITVAAYSYMALVPIVQPPIIRLLTTKKERRIRMDDVGMPVSRLTRILFPIIVTIITGLVAPKSVALVGFLMFGNLIRECGVLNSLSDTAQKVLANLVTLLLGITVAGHMRAENFLRVGTLLILGLGLVAFVADTAGGVLFAKIMNLFTKKKVNPMIGAAGISAFPMSSRVVHKMGLKEDPQNFLLMPAAGANVAGQVASVIAGGMILNFAQAGFPALFG